MTDAIYTSTDAGVISAIETAERVRLEWGQKLKALGRELMPDSTTGNFYSSDMTFFAFDLDGTMPTGWKWAPRNKPGIVPDKRTTEGKAWAKRIEPLKSKPSVPAPEGMAQGFFGSKGGEFYWFRPSFAVVDGVAWCRWGAEPDQPIDEAIWTKRKLSEFYAMTEAREIEVDA